jgi:hypothetical protein
MGYGLVYKIYTYNNEYLIGVLYSKIKKLVLFGILTLVVYECFCVFVLLMCFSVFFFLKSLNALDRT